MVFLKTTKVNPTKTEKQKFFSDPKGGDKRKITEIILNHGNPVDDITVCVATANNLKKYEEMAYRTLKLSTKLFNSDKIIVPNLDEVAIANAKLLED
jgi:hypothetical protein